MGTLDRSGGRGRCRKGHNVFVRRLWALGSQLLASGTGKHGVRGLREYAW